MTARARNWSLLLWSLPGVGSIIDGIFTFEHALPHFAGIRPIPQLDRRLRRHRRRPAPLTHLAHHEPIAHRRGRPYPRPDGPVLRHIHPPPQPDSSPASPA
jgi:hypothetical protein